MMMNTTLDQLRGLKLVSMAQALHEQMQQSGISAMSFEERLALLSSSRRKQVPKAPIKSI
jgi:hypothetical protein